jgi:hypothetical protein
MRVCRKKVILTQELREANRLDRQIPIILYLIWMVIGAKKLRRQLSLDALIHQFFNQQK